jgi:hypothetical protein
MTDAEKVEVLIAALRRIAESDPGPAYHIAKDALEEVQAAPEVV